MQVEVLDCQTPETHAVREALLEFNARRIGPSGFRPLEVLLRAPEGHVVAGLGGSTYWEWLVIDTAWVHPTHRRHGLGRRLLQAAEAQAVARGCRAACLETYSFQDARPFYEAAGYRVCASQRGFPPGHERYLMTKDLVPAAG